MRGPGGAGAGTQAGSGCGLGLPPVPVEPCASVPGAGTHIDASNTCPRSILIFPRLPCHPFLTPLCFSVLHLFQQITEVGVTVIPVLIKILVPSYVFLAGRRELIHFCVTPSALGLVLGSDSQKDLVSMWGVPALFPAGKVPRASCSPQREVFPSFGAVLELFLGGHQALVRRADNAWVGGKVAPDPQNPLQPHRIVLSLPSLLSICPRLG